MDRYFQKLGVYYDEKIKFLSGKDKFISCNKCDSKKEFKETFEKLVFTCGSKGKCGDQIIITFPKYTHCESTLRELREELNTGLNWTSIHNFLDVSKELEDSEEKNKRIRILETKLSNMERWSAEMIEESDRKLIEQNIFNNEF